MPFFYLFFCAFGFLSGSILFSYLLPKWIKGVDILALSDDHNPGTANAMHFAGAAVGSLCLLCDLMKGFLPVFLTMRFAGSQHPLFALVLAAPVAGHAFSPWLRGRGGKAIAVTFGVLLGLLPQFHCVFYLAALYLFFSVVLVISPHASRSIVVFGLLMVWTFLRRVPPFILYGVIACSLIVICKHLFGISQFSISVQLFGKKWVAGTGHPVSNEPCSSQQDADR